MEWVVDWSEKSPRYSSHLRQVELGPAAQYSPIRKSKCLRVDFDVFESLQRADSTPPFIAEIC